MTRSGLPVDRVLFIICSTILFLTNSFAGSNRKSPDRISIFEWKQLDANNINCTIANDGPFADYRKTGQSGLEWPKGSGKTAVFTAGLWLVGKESTTDSIRAAVAYYTTDYQPGPINGVFSGDVSVAAGKNDPRYRIYKIQKADTIGGVNPDYDEWPVDQGAPVDFMGKPKFFGDQQLFTVFNDLDTLGRRSTSASRPLGLEVRALFWGFESIPYLQDVMFVRWEIINKSVFTYDSTYVSIWSDVDMGDANDDQTGCDTLLHMGYFYNDDDLDATSAGYGYQPPAVGFLLVQGPTSDAGSVLPMTSFIANLKNMSGGRFDDLPLGNATLPTKAFNYMRGLDAFGEPIIDPLTGNATRFMFPGDPVTGLGWLPRDWNIRGSDKRLHVNSGPFTFTPLDTQRVVAAVMVAQGGNRLMSVSELRRAAYNVRNFYESSFTLTSLPTVVHSVTFAPPSGQTTATIRLEEPGAISARAFFVNPAGSAVDSVDLYDDGSHSDEAAGDGLWANSWATAPLSYGLSVDLRIQYVSGQTLTWRGLVRKLSTAGPVRASSYSLSSDNINSDGVVNPGENIRYVYTLTNEGSIAFSDLTVKVEGVTDNRITVTPGEQAEVASLGAQATVSLVYDEADPKSYFSFAVPEDVLPGTEFSILLEILDRSENRWVDTLNFKVDPYAYAPISNLSTHTVGNSEGTFGVLVVDYPSLKDHTYEIRAVDSVDAAGDVGFTLIDVTDGRTLLERHPLPDDSGHNIQVTDGFKVTKGTALYPEEYPGPRAKDWSYSPSENRFITGKATSEVMDTFLGGLAYPRVGVYVNKGTTVAGDSLKRVEIIFSDQNREKAYRYLTRVSASTPLYDASFTPYVLQRGGGYVYQDYVEVPFTAWEVDPFDKDATPRQLNVAFLERNDSLYSPTGAYLGRGKIDGQWYPTTADNGGGEVVYIFASTYSDQENSFYTGKNLFTDQNNLDILYVLWARLDGSLPQVFREGDVFTIYPQYPPVRGGNVYSFNPVLLEVRPQGELPSEYALYQNYPNPFNPTTTIRYELPKESRVKLEIYDILGQKVATPVDEEKNAGRYEVRWDAARFSTGVYFYRLQAGEFREMKKLMLLR